MRTAVDSQKRAHRAVGPTSKAWRATRLVIVATVVIGSLASCQPAWPPTKNGVFAGCCAQAKVNAFGTWLGRTPDLVVDFLPGGNWEQVEHPVAWVAPWTGSPWQMSFSVPMLVPGATLAIGATGAYNSHFATLAQELVDRGLGDAILRLGWEFNGFWYPWRAKPDRDAFKQYWRKIVKAMRSVSGANFKFDWNPIIGKYEFPAVEAYPGDAFVDYIGMDIYDKSDVHYPIPAGATAQEAQNRRQAVWNEHLNGNEGLTYWALFAQDHGKRISLPEWGLMTPSYVGGGDNVYFIEQLHNWILWHDVAYHAYFNSTGGLGDHRLTGATTFPAAAARYQELFG